MTKLEKDIEQELRERVTALGGVCLKWVCPGWSGVPDRIVIMPGGRVYFIELKRPKGGRYSPMQDWWRDKLMGLRCNYFRICNRVDVCSFLLALDKML